MELLRVWREMDDRDEEPVVIYHSHTATEAYPSRTDITLAQEPGAHYVLVSTRDPDETEFRSFRIVDGVVTEEEVRISRPTPPGQPWNDPPGRRCWHPVDDRPTLESSTWPSKSAFRPSCAPIPAGPRRWRAQGRRWKSCSATWTPGTAGCANGCRTSPGCAGFVNVYLNDEDVRFLGGLKTPVKDGDTVTVLPAVAGGAR